MNKNIEYYNNIIYKNANIIYENIILGEKMKRKISNDEYHSHGALGRSQLRWLDLGLDKFEYYCINKNSSPFGAALNFGSAFHLFCLEPEEFRSKVAIEGKFDKRTKEGKENCEKWTLENYNKIIITEQESYTIKMMYSSLSKNPINLALLGSPEEREISIFWKDQETGVECKSRPDILLNKGIINDLKTCRNEGASRRNFLRSFYDGYYHLQSAMFFEAYKALTGENAKILITAIEKEEPYSVYTYHINQERLQHGKDLFRKCLRTYADCMSSGKWQNQNSIQTL